MSQVRVHTACTSSRAAHCASHLLFNLLFTIITAGTNADTMTSVAMSVVLDTLDFISTHSVMQCPWEAARA